MATTINNNFFSYLKSIDRCSENTVETYTRNINEFLAYADKPEDELDSFDIMHWAESLKDKGYASGTVHQKVSSVKSYMKFLAVFHIIPSNPAADIKTPKAKAKEKHYMDMDMVLDMIKACKNSRDRAIITTYVFTGMRVSELTSITLTEYLQMKKDNSNYIVITGKGDKERKVIFNEDTCSAIDEYLKDRKSYNGCDCLFLSFKGNKIARNNLNCSLKSIARDAGIPWWRDFSNHQLRSAAASIYNKNGVPVATIQHILGHANLATTSLYIKTSERDMANAVMNMSLR